MKGVYCLVIEVPDATAVEIGALGWLKFERGFYTYVGSAQNNLEKRVSRHLKKKKQLRWHIDYLLSKNVSVRKVLWKPGSKKEECRISKSLAKSADIIKGFGCSDCPCKSHLFRLRSLDMLFELKLKELKVAE